MIHWSYATNELVCEYIGGSRDFISFEIADSDYILGLQIYPMLDLQYFDNHRAEIHCHVTRSGGQNWSYRNQIRLN
jgi:hypothetical protein